MKSDLPKVLFPALGRPMIHWVLDALEQSGVSRILVVVGYRHEEVRKELAGRKNIEFVLQEQLLGTGHAVQMCIPNLTEVSAGPPSESGDNDPVLILAGDSPLVQPSSLRGLLDTFHQQQYACLLGTLLKDDPKGLGRIVRDAQGHFVRIVEQKDATPEEALIREVNMSTYVFTRHKLLSALSKLTNKNAQSEYYLTDCPEILMRAGERVEAVAILQPCESLSINTIDELEIVENKIGRAHV